MRSIYYSVATLATPTIIKLTPPTETTLTRRKPWLVKMSSVEASAVQKAAKEDESSEEEGQIMDDDDDEQQAAAELEERR